MEDSESGPIMEGGAMPTNEENESHKVHCKECDGHDDCPRMRGINYCLGAEKWLRERSKKDEPLKKGG
jgi:hypothetical protein